jgi:hypothetical protein
MRSFGSNSRGIRRPRNEAENNAQHDGDCGQDLYRRYQISLR